VGDTPLIGAGTWADDRVAISCTGEGEAFIRAAAAHRLALAMQAGATLAQAGADALAAVGAVGGVGGLIAVDGDGEVTMPFTTEVMNRAVWRAGESSEAWT
jgi:isoaspartyl peptidase/L-asparaginase-like protein (Ntn-hydrolase superfamily)